MRAPALLLCLSALPAYAADERLAQWGDLMVPYQQIGSGSSITAPPPAVALGKTTLAFNQDFSTGISLSNTGTGAGFTWYNPGVWFYTGTNTTPFIASSSLNLTWTVGDRAGGAAIGTMSADGLHNTSWQYGYFEVSAAFASPTGQFPAFWMQGNTGTTDFTSIINNTHNYFELDGFEHLTNQPNDYLGTIHTWQGTGGTPTDVSTNNSTNATAFPSGFNLANFNTYGWSWTPTQICWYFNNTLMHCADSTTFPTAFASANTQPMYLMLQNQIGGGTPTPTVNTNVAIQFVHIWQ